MNRKPYLLILSALLLVLALTACAPNEPQPLAAVSTSTTQPERVVTPVAEISPTAAAPTDLPHTEEVVDLPPTAEAVTLPSPTVEPPAEPWVTYIGADENLWIINPARGEMRQITQDAQPFEPGLDNITYCCGVWSSDGQYMAYSRQVGIPVAEGGYNYTFELWVFDINTGQSRQLLADRQISTFSWQPGTHTITFAPSIHNQYFSMHGVDPAYASGIWTVDVDSGDTAELVKPERGFTIVNPKWSPDGRFVSFEEVYLMEGTGKFAYYEPAAGEYTAWDVSIGGYRWAPDGESLYYDYLTYAPSGSERIFRNNRHKTDEQQISPDYANAIAYSPLLTPDGTQVIYTVETMPGDGTGRYEVVIEPAAGGDVRMLGEFEQPGELSISADGSLLLLGTGPWDNRQIQLITLADGSARTLVQGKQPAWQPVGAATSAP